MSTLEGPSLTCVFPPAKSSSLIAISVNLSPLPSTLNILYYFDSAVGIMAKERQIINLFYSPAKYRATGGPMKIAELQGYELTQSFIDSVISLGYKERDYNGEFQEGICN